jgi:chromosomal replication initiator protein
MANRTAMPAAPASVGSFDAAFAHAIQASILQRIGEARYKLWFAPHTRFTLTDGRLIVHVPNEYFQGWLHRTFADAVKAAGAEVVGAAIEVAFVINSSLFKATDPAATPATKAEPMPPTPTKELPKAKVVRKKAEPDTLGDLFETPEPVPAAKPAKAEPEPTPAAPAGMRKGRRWHTLSHFVVGPCNRVAHAAAQAAVEEPAQAANPLVLYGPVGTGKTHLLEGIYVGLRKSWPEERVTFVTAEDFTNRFVQAMRFGKLAGFRNQFRSCSALLLDDLHFLATKQRTQEEFLHTFDALLSDGKQVVVTADCHPRLMEELLPELADRLLGGAVWSVTPPDTATRFALLSAKAAQPGPAVPEAVLQLLADALRGNVRELEGALHSVRHFSRVTGKPVDVKLAREALGELLRHAVRVVQPADIDAAVTTVLRLPTGVLRQAGRAFAISHPRMLAIYLARKHTTASYGAISTFFGGKSHSTAVAAEKKVRQWLQGGHALALGGREWPLRDLLERIERELQR